MKYIDKVIKRNADGENYSFGVRIELSDLELKIIASVVEESLDWEDVSIPYELRKELFKKLTELYDIKHNGYLKNIEID